MPGRSPYRFVTIGLLAVVAVAVGAAAAASDGAGLRITVDYLPPFVYYRESIALRVRVHNPWSSPATCRLSIRLDRAVGPDRELEPAEVLTPAKGSAQIAFDLPSSLWSSATVGFRHEDESHEIMTVHRFDETARLPELSALGERLFVAKSGDAAVIALTQRVSQQDREWYLWKRFADRLGEGSLPAGVLLAGARLSGQDEEPPYMRAVRDGAGTWVEAQPLEGERSPGVVHPIVADAAAALNALEASRGPELVVWVVACDDARRATPRRIFRKAADLMLFKSRLNGASRLSVLFVPEPGVPGDRRALYAEELRSSVRAYRGTFVRVDELGDAGCWVSPSAVESRALMRYPNSSGHEALSRAVLGRIRR